jgi:membrane protease YdiL (CAAX protease family)
MVENMLRQTSKKKWYTFSIYINIILFFIVALFTYFLVRDSIDFGRGIAGRDGWMYIARNIAFMAVALALIFFQFFRNLFVIIKRSL